MEPAPALHVEAFADGSVGWGAPRLKDGAGGDSGDCA